MRYDEQIIDNINRQEEIDRNINNLLKVKPKIYKQEGHWVCRLGNKLGIGFDPVVAYNNWINQ